MALKEGKYLKSIGFNIFTNLGRGKAVLYETQLMVEV